jgi:autonomous glycyl radical cofactor GrcA
MTAASSKKGNKMKSFIVKSIADDDFITTWIVNAENHKEAKRMVINHDDFEEDESIVSCDEINNKKEGVVFVEAFAR